MKNNAVCSIQQNFACDISSIIVILIFADEKMDSNEFSTFQYCENVRHNNYAMPLQPHTLQYITQKTQKKNEETKNRLISLEVRTQSFYNFPVFCVDRRDATCSTCYTTHRIILIAIMVWLCGLISFYISFVYH